MTVACVLQGGGRYDHRWVEELWASVRQHNGRFRTISVLGSMWPGWWAKMRLFEPAVLEGPTIYMDLDSVCVGDLSELASYTGELALLSDFNRPYVAQSGVMLITPGKETERLWKLFTADPEGHMARYRGDGEWLHAHAQADRIQDLYPGQVVSYKRDVKPNGDKLPPNARIVAFHGSPKQDDFDWRMPWE